MAKAKHPVNVATYDNRSFGDRAADAMTNFVGSWRYLIGQNIVVALWTMLNVIAFVKHWDPYPFILLNLVFSWQASNTGPVLQLSQNRQTMRDRLKADHDYTNNQQSLTLLRHIVSAGGASPDDILKAEELLDDSNGS